MGALAADLEAFLDHRAIVARPPSAWTTARLFARRNRRQVRAATLGLVLTLVASEVQRVRAPARASERAVADFLHDLLNRRLIDGAEVVARADELDIDLREGAAIVVIRAQLHVPSEEGWRERVVTVAARGARAAASTAITASSGRPDAAGSEVVLKGVVTSGSPVSSSGLRCIGAQSAGTGEFRQSLPTA